MKFSRRSGDIQPITTDLSVRPIGSESAEDFAAIAGPAFDFLPDFQPALASLVDASGWRVFMSFDGKTPAGTGAVFMRDGVAYLDFGATHRNIVRAGFAPLYLRENWIPADG